MSYVFSSKAPLVFPQAKPYGVNSSTSRETIRDESAFPTEVIDYLKFDIFDHRENTLKDTIYLYLPKTLKEEYAQDWGAVKLGAAGDAIKDAARKVIDAKGDLGQASFSDELKQFADSGVNQLGFKAGADAINSALGVVGQNAGLDRDSLASLTTGKIFNPYAESVFKGQQSFRKHNWTWTMIPKNAKEVRTIYQIIKTFRQSVLPGKSDKNWLNIPEYFRAQIVRYVDRGGGNEEIGNPKNGGFGGILSSIMQFPTKLVCDNFSINMPDYRSVRSTMANSKEADFGALRYDLSLSFQETEFLTKETFEPPGFNLDSNTNWSEPMDDDELYAWAGNTTGLW